MKHITKFILTFFIIIFSGTFVFSAPYVNLKLSYDGKVHSYNQEMVYLYINGKRVTELPMQPIIFNGSTLVPARETFENLGAEVTWKKETSEIGVLYQGNVVNMNINKQVATVNDVEYTMPIVPKLINSKTMIPVRFVSEAMGLNVEWEPKSRIVNISNINVSTTEQTTETTTQSTETTTTMIVEEQPNGDIIAIEMPNSDQNTFYIYADKKIEDYNIQKLENGFYELTINNLGTTLEEKSLDSYSNYVYKVDIKKVENSVKFIFNTTEDTTNTIFLSEDGKRMGVNFGGNKISKIEKFTDNSDDFIRIYPEYEINYDIKNITTANQATITLKNVNSDLIYEDFKDTSYVKEMKYYQEGTNLIIDIYTEGSLNIKAIQETQSILFKIGNISQEEIKEEPSTIVGNGLSIPKNKASIDINSIKHQDDYLNKKYILKFNQDISSIFPQGEYKIENNLVKNVLTKNVNGLTEITINSNKLIAVNITEDTNNIYINIVTPKEKYKNIVVIDPGHGGSDPGTSGYSLLEKNIVLDISNKLVSLIENDPNIKVYSSRVTDVYPSFDDRTSLANEVGDMFVSVHINAPGNKSNTNASGTEVYYLNFNTSTSGLNSKVMADTFQKNIVATLNTKDRGIKTANFKVLRDSKIPSVLCEIAFITNPEDNKKLASDEYKSKTANALYTSIKELFTKYPTKR